MTSVAFTGTRRGMTIVQWQKVQDVLADLYSVDRRGSHVWHDGDCIGADDQAHKTVEYLNGLVVGQANQADRHIKTHGHPWNRDEKLRAFNEFDIIHEPAPPLVRNRAMVDASEIVVAAPFEFEEVIRGSGTWATIRYAKLCEKKLFIAWPDGLLQDFNFKS
jgi:hypothetical protein